MATTYSRDLEVLGAGGLELADPTEDIRGHIVLDRKGDTVGEVDDLLIDPGQRRVRMLILAIPWLLGLATKRRLVPMEIVHVNGDERVTVDRSRDVIMDSPAFEGEEDEAAEMLHLAVYDWYGVTPYWATSAKRVPGR
jgi:sporulation protein YlmC with PRC-barrel domain